MATGTPGVSLELVMPDFTDRMAGIARNFQEDRIDLVQGVLVAT